MCIVCGRLQGEGTNWHFKGSASRLKKITSCHLCLTLRFHQVPYTEKFIFFSSPPAATGSTQSATAHIAPGYVIYELLNTEALQTELIFRHFLLSPVSSVSHSLLGMICIPVPSAWSGPTDATLRACWTEAGPSCSVFSYYSYIGDFSLLPLTTASPCQNHLNMPLNITSARLVLSIRRC